MIIDKMTEWKKAEVNYKIAPQDSLSIIGSNSIHTRGDLYTININAIDNVVNRRNKRLLDFVVASFLLVTYPVLVFIVRKPAKLIRNIIFVLVGKRTWVSYCAIKDKEQHLPYVKQGILSPVDGMRATYPDKETIMNLNLLYARDYNVWKDLNILLFAFRRLGN